MTKDDIVVALNSLSYSDLAAIKHAANKLMYEMHRDSVSDLITNPQDTLNNLEKLNLPNELKEAMAMNREAIMTAYGVMKSLGLVTESESGPTNQQKERR